MKQHRNTLLDIARSTPPRKLGRPRVNDHVSRYPLVMAYLRGEITGYQLLSALGREDAAPSLTSQVVGSTLAAAVREGWLIPSRDAPAE